jgi:type I site-specific restriction-modification system R (restriction) subunit
VFLTVMAVLAAGTALSGLGPPWLFELLLLFGAGAELLYLGIVPRNARFRRHVRSQKQAEHREPPAQSEIYRRLHRRSQRRYYKLRELKDEIRANYRQLSYASQGLLDNHLNKIDGLLRSYLELLHQRERYRDLAEQTSEDSIRTAIRELKDDMADDAERVRSVKQRRLNVLEKRLARFRKAQENLEIIGAQLGTIEDVVKYIHEQSWTLQNPDEVTMQLDALVDEVEETQRTIHEIEDVFSPASDALDDDLEALDEELNAATDGALDLPEDEAATDDETTSPQQSRVRE